MDKTYLKFEQIGMSFRRGQMATEVLRDIDLSIAQGEFVSMIGHSGCGKSTLLNILGGLLKSTTGEVFLEGKVVDEPGPDRAIVFQNHSLLPWLTVYGNVAIAVDKVFGSRKSKAERHDWVMHNLELVQMAQAKDKRPHEVSGGMKQRVGIGFFIWDAWNSSRISDIIVALVYIGIVGFLLDKLIATVGHFVSHGVSAQ